MALELRDGCYVEAGRASGDEELLLERPFPVSVVPSALVSGGPLPDEQPGWGR